MADNVDITPGQGATVAADDIGGIKYQRIKLTLGADGASQGDLTLTGGAVPIGGYGNYTAVAASQTNATLGATGAAGDRVDGVLVVPANLNPGSVTIRDNAQGAITLFTGGTGSILSLIPFPVPFPAISANGAWKLTTGANVSAVGFGKFT